MVNHHGGNDSDGSLDKAMEEANGVSSACCYGRYERDIKGMYHRAAGSLSMSAGHGSSHSPKS